MQNDTSVIQLETNQIIPNQYQPRKVFDEKALEDLAISIKTYGIINPILVRKKADKYEIIAGERRFRAAQKIGLTTVPVIIKTVDEQQMAELALMENIQRQELTAIEEAKSYEEILKIGNETQSSLAEKLGKSQSAIANKIRLLSLPEEIQEALAEKKISERHARSLLSVKDKERQLVILNRIINERLTVKETEQVIKEKEVTEDEIKQAISDIMKSLNIKEEEKEDDNMNNGNFFPNYTTTTNNNNSASLNMMNMQSMNPQPENIMPAIEPQMISPMVQAPIAPMPEPQAMQPFDQPQFMPNMQMPTMEPQMAPTMPEFTPTEPVAPAPLMNDVPLFAPETSQPVMSEPILPAVEQPLFNPSAEMPTIEPQMAPVMPGFTSVESQPLPEPTIMSTPTFEVPVVEPVMEAPKSEDRLTNLQDLLTANGYIYKVYSNETENCIIVELPKN